MEGGGRSVAEIEQWLLRLSSDEDDLAYSRICARERRIFIALYADGYEALEFPHLFPYGHGHFTQARDRSIRFRDYARYMMELFSDIFRRDAKFTNWLSTVEKRLLAEVVKEIAAEEAAPAGGAAAAPELKAAPTGDPGLFSHCFSRKPSEYVINFYGRTCGDGRGKHTYSPAGRGGCGAVCFSLPNLAKVWEASWTLGTACSSDVAEYMAVIKCLQYHYANFSDAPNSIRLEGHSELILKQLAGQHAVESQSLQALHWLAVSLVKQGVNQLMHIQNNDTSDTSWTKLSAMGKILQLQGLKASADGQGLEQITYTAEEALANAGIESANSRNREYAAMYRPNITAVGEARIRTGKFGDGLGDSLVDTYTSTDTASAFAPPFYMIDFDFFRLISGEEGPNAIRSIVTPQLCRANEHQMEVLGVLTRPLTFYATFDHKNGLDSVEKVSTITKDVLVVRDLPVPFHMAFQHPESVTDSIRISRGDKLKKEFFENSYQTHPYWNPGDTYFMAGPEDASASIVYHTKRPSAREGLRAAAPEQDPVPEVVVATGMASWPTLGYVKVHPNQTKTDHNPPEVLAEDPAVWTPNRDDAEWLDPDGGVRVVKWGPVEINLLDFTEFLLEITDRVLRPHRCSFGTAASYLLAMLTAALLMTSSHSEG